MAGFGFILKVLFGIGCAFFCIILAWILWGQMVNKPSGDEAFVFVLGCAVNGEEPSSVLTYRLDAAYDYYLAHPDVTLVVTGGQGATEVIAEAVVMQRYLIEKGVPAAQILVESESTSTEENFRFSKELLQTNGYTIDDDTPIVYITNGFHCMRAGLYAANEGFTNVSVIAAGMPLMQLLPCYLREVFAVVYYLAFKSPNVGFLKNYIGYLAIFGKR